MNWTGSIALPDQVTGVEVESEFGAMIECFQGTLGSVDVKGNFGRMNFQGEPHTALTEHIQDRIESLGQQIEAGIDHARRDRRKRIQQVPDAAAGESVDHVDAKLLGRPGRVLQFFDRPAR